MFFFLYARSTFCIVCHTPFRGARLFFLGLGPGPVCTTSSTVQLIAVLLYWLNGLAGCQYSDCLRTSYNNASLSSGSHKKSRSKEQRGHAEHLEREERKTGMEIVSTKDEAA